MALFARFALAFLLLTGLLGCQSAPPPAPLEPNADFEIDAALARGETVALVFWQSWCDSCRREAPSVVRAAGTERGRIRFKTVVPGKPESVDEDEVATKRKAWGYEPLPFMRDPDLALSKELGVRGTPTFVVLGQGRKVLYREHALPSDWAPLRGKPFEQ